MRRLLGLCLWLGCFAPLAAQPCESDGGDESAWRELRDAGRHARERNRLDDARELLLEAQRAAGELGVGRPSYLEATRDRVDLLTRMHRRERAWRVAVEAVERIERSCGDDHSALIRALNLQATYDPAALDDPARVVPQYERAVAIAERNGLDDARTLESTLLALSWSYYRLGRLEQAIEVAERLYDRMVLEELRPDTRLAHLGHWYAEAGRYEQALPILRATLEASTERSSFERARDRYAAALTAAGDPDFAREVRAMAPPWEVDLPPWPAPAETPPRLAGRDGVGQPRLIESRPPVYPDAARVERYEGSVLLQIVVESDGSVGRIEVLRASHEGVGFEEAAREAVSRWRYTPATKNGSAVPVFLTVNVDFRLN